MSMIISEIFKTEQEKYLMFVKTLENILSENSGYDAMLDMQETKKSVIIYFKKKQEQRFRHNPMSLYAAHITDNFYNHLSAEKKQNALDTLRRIITKRLLDGVV